MSKWQNPAEWERLRSGAECPICRAGAPQDIVVELASSWVTAQRDSPMRGYACLVSKRHVAELHEFTASEAAAFVADAQHVSAALAAITQAVKLNYEIHGNTIPHLHMHFFPRYRGDQFEGGPINPRVIVQPVYGAGEYEQFREKLATALEV